MLSISVNQIQYVLALERTGNFSAAADLCFVTQSTLSTMIKRLEKQIGFQLFDRKSKPIQLTQQGQKIINQLKVIHNEYENLIELTQITNNEYHGTLKLGIIPTLAPFLLPLILDNLIGTYPNITLHISEITTNEIINRLRLRDLDIGVLSLPVLDKSLVQTSLFKEEFLVYDAGYVSQNKKKYKIGDIDVSRLLLLEESHCLSSQIGKICNLREQHKNNGKLVFNSSSILSLIELVNLNMGVTLLPRLAALQSNIVNQKWIHDLQSPVPVRDVGLVTNKQFTKKTMFNILQQEILAAVKPVIKTNKKILSIDPF